MFVPTANRSPVCFNSRTPCGVRRERLLRVGGKYVFQFTHPVWGATQPISNKNMESTVSIHAPRVGCDTKVTQSSRSSTSFNSRTPCGARLGSFHLIDLVCKFQFTHPVRGATAANSSASHLRPVSIHAPRAGCDSARPRCETCRSRFNSRTPCGVRL